MLFDSIVIAGFWVLFFSFDFYFNFTVVWGYVWYNFSSFALAEDCFDYVIDFRVCAIWWWEEYTLCCFWVEISVEVYQIHLSNDKFRSRISLLIFSLNDLCNTYINNTFSQQQLTYLKIYVSLNIVVESAQNN